jgi:hypothetical protein
VDVELRMWRSIGSAHGTKLVPVTVRAVLTERGAGPVLLLEDNDGDALAYPPEETRGEEFGSILVPYRPSPEQTRLLAEAAEAGYPVEPRVVREAFLTAEEL